LPTELPAPLPLPTELPAPLPLPAPPEPVSPPPVAAVDPSPPQAMPIRARAAKEHKKIWLLRILIGSFFR
jgi:hypothetical protein